MSEPTFRPPFGGAVSHVTDPRDHHGYRYIVALGADSGSHAEYIRRQCAQAKKDGAPTDAVYKRRSTAEWVTVAELPPVRLARVEQYVAAMVAYEKQVEAARDAGFPGLGG